MRAILAVTALLCLAACGREAPARAASADPATTADTQKAAAPSEPAAPRPTGPLSAADFTISGAADQTDSARVRELLGSPDSVRTEDNPFNPGDTLVTWHYPGMSVAIGDGKVYGFALTGPGAETPRGLRVGDTAERVRELYGAPGGTYENSWDYPDPADGSGLHVIRVEVENGRVTHIWVGWLLD